MNDKAYQEGKEAFNNMEASNSCPYYFDCEEYRDWAAGWFDARDECTNFFYGD